MNLFQKLIRNWKSQKIKLVSEPGWVCVYESTDEYTLRIKKLQLDDHEIPASIFDQRDFSYNAFGMLYLYVPREFEKDARKVLNLPDEKPAS